MKTLKKEIMRQNTVTHNLAERFIDWNILVYLRQLNFFNLEIEKSKIFNDKEEYYSFASSSLNTLPLFSPIPVACLLGMTMTTPLVWLSFPLVSIVFFYTLCMFRMNKRKSQIRKGIEPEKFSNRELFWCFVGSLLVSFFVIFNINESAISMNAR